MISQSSSIIPHVDNLYFYRRRDGILYGVSPDAVETPLVKFKTKHIDVLILEGQGLQYVKDYMQMWPDKWEYVQDETPKQQLSLF